MIAAASGSAVSNWSKGKVGARGEHGRWAIADGALVIEQTFGTAPGLIVEHDGKVIYAVPGVPAEMRVRFAVGNGEGETVENLDPQQYFGFDLDAKVGKGVHLNFGVSLDGTDWPILTVLRMWISSCSPSSGMSFQIDSPIISAAV